MISSMVTLEEPDLLDCPICLEPLRAPVYQCYNGHLLCKSCHTKVNYKCPSCSMVFGSNRCTAIEKILESSQRSCRNFQRGCAERVSYVTKSEHEKTCNFSPILCPFPDCNYTDVSKSLYTHFAEAHRSSAISITFNTVSYVSVSLITDVNRVILQERGEKVLFVLNSITDPLGTFVNVTCVAPTTSEMKFSYDLSARAGNNSVSLTTAVELNPDCVAKPVKEKCLLISNGFREHLTTLELKLVIRKRSRISVLYSTLASWISWINNLMFWFIVVGYWCVISCLVSGGEQYYWSGGGVLYI